MEEKNKKIKNKSVLKTKIFLQLKNKKWMVVSIFLFLLLGGSLLTSGFGIQKLLYSSSSDVVAKEAIDYINKNLLPAGQTASLVESSKESNGTYKIKFKLGEQEIISYISNDGNMLFPSGYEMKASLAQAQNQQQQGQEEIPKKDTPDVKLFVMSYCPYGNQAEDLMMPVIELLGSKANLTLRYIVSKSSDGKYISLHGEKELDQDVREICVQKYQNDKFWDFIKEINSKTTVENVETKWEGIAKSIGINVEKIKECQKNEASTLLDDEIKLTDKYKITGSPSLLINEIVYQGDRTSNAYKEAICSGFQNPPEECGAELSDTGASSGGGRE